eukprot:m.15058 g.15058  ORF g.15058 m.15058 type:complete len:56 (-) comp7780_c0_seq1:163-330(-)
MPAGKPKKKKSAFCDTFSFVDSLSNSLSPFLSSSLLSSLHFSAPLIDKQNESLPC